MKKNLKRFTVLASTFVITTLLLTGCELKINSKGIEFNSNKSENTIKIGDTDEKIVTQIRHEVKHEEDTKSYIVITGLNEDGETLWTYETKKDYAAQYDTIEYLGEFNNKVYINEIGTISALNMQTGEVKWSNSDYKGCGSEYVFDKDGYLYLTSQLDPKLFVVSPEGETITRIKSFGEDDDNYLWPEKITIAEENTLIITYPMPGLDDEYGDNKNTIHIDIRDIKNTENKSIACDKAPEVEHSQIGGFEEIKSFLLDENGTFSISFEPNSKFYSEINNGITPIDYGIRSITPVFWGNGGYGSLVLIRKDGSAAVIDSMNVSMGNLDLRELNVKKAKYVIKFYDLDGSAYGIVDEDGNVHIDRV